ncbi:MAG TPA: hypothetical protein VHK27_13775 [Gammaproteobacteria bacterium]|nr:hypothetical protein [Gammaproteobacteria bacterium]
MKVTVYLLFAVGIDWSDGRSSLKSVHGSLDQAKNAEAVPVSLRGQWRTVPERGELSGWGSRILTCTYFDIYAKEVEIG